MHLCPHLYLPVIRTLAKSPGEHSLHGSQWSYVLVNTKTNINAPVICGQLTETCLGKLDFIYPFYGLCLS